MDEEFFNSYTEMINSGVIRTGSFILSASYEAGHGQRHTANAQNRKPDFRHECCSYIPEQGGGQQCCLIIHNACKDDQDNPDHFILFHGRMSYAPVESRFAGAPPCFRLMGAPVLSIDNGGTIFLFYKDRTLWPISYIGRLLPQCRLCSHRHPDNWKSNRYPPVFSRIQDLQRPVLEL